MSRTSRCQGRWDAGQEAQWRLKLCQVPVSRSEVERVHCAVQQAAEAGTVPLVSLFALSRSWGSEAARLPASVVPCGAYRSAPRAAAVPVLRW